MEINQEVSKDFEFEDAAKIETPTLFNRMIFVLICVMLIFSVVAYGGVDLWALGIFSFLSGLIVILWLADAWKTGRLKFNSSYLQIPLLGLILIGLVQLLPLRSFDISEGLLSVSPVSSLSLDPYLTRLAVIHLIVYFVFFAAVLTFVNNRNRLKTLVLTIIIFSSVMAFYGILQRLANSEIVYMRPARFSNPFASFFNQHHFAAFMEMTIGLTLGILFGKGAKKNMRIFLVIAAVIMGMAIIFTGSRGGLISLLAVLGFIVAANVLWGSRKAEAGVPISNFRRNLVLTASGIILILFVFGSVILLGGDESLVRGMGLHGDREDFSGGRTHFWQVALQIFSDYPILGAGLDTFGTAFTQYDTWNGINRVEQAHNDYLQILADAGILGFACVAAFIYLLFKYSLPTISKAPDKFRQSTAIGALAGCSGILLHSFFDFPLRTPSNAFYFLTMAALATVPIFYSKLRRKRVGK